MITVSLLRKRHGGASLAPPSEKTANSTRKDERRPYLRRGNLLSVFNSKWSDSRPSKSPAPIRERPSGKFFRTRKKSDDGDLSSSSLLNTIVHASSSRGGYRRGSSERMSSRMATSISTQPFCVDSSTVLDDSAEDDAICTLPDDSYLLQLPSEHGSSFESSKSNGLEETIERFRKREEACAFIVSGKSAAYRDMIIANEIACREKTLARYGGVSMPALPPSEVTSPDATIPTQNASALRLRGLQRLILFEVYLSLHGVWSAVWYCLGHYSLFNLVEAAATLAHSLSGLTPFAFHGLMILFGLFVMRINGYLWEWLSPESYRVVKFDMHNRALLGFWDARILAVLDETPFSQVNPVVSMLAFYSLFIGCHFYYDYVADAGEKWFWFLQKTLEDQVVGMVDVPPGTLPCDTFLFIKEPTLLNRFAHSFCRNSEGDSKSITPLLAFYVLGTFVSAIAKVWAGGTLFDL